MVALVFRVSLLTLVITASPHHVLRNLVEVSLDPGWQSARDKLVCALQFAIVESLLPIFNFLRFVLLQRLLDLGQPDGPLGLSLLGLGTAVARVILGRF